MNISVVSSRRILVAELHCTKNKSLGIIKEMGYDASIVDCTVATLKQGKTHSPRHYKKCIKRFFGGLKQGNSIERKIHSPKSDKKCTKRFLGGFKLSIATDLSMAELTRKRNVSKMTISEAVRNDLLQKMSQHFHSKIKSYCKKRSTLLLHHLKHCGGYV